MRAILSCLVARCLLFEERILGRGSTDSRAMCDLASCSSSLFISHNDSWRKAMFVHSTCLVGILVVLRARPGISNSPLHSSSWNWRYLSTLHHMDAFLGFALNFAHFGPSCLLHLALSSHFCHCRRLQNAGRSVYSTTSLELV
jgi:hypothetical protein